MASSRLCSIPDCGKPRVGRLYCNAHRGRLRSHGDPLGGGTYEGAPKAFLDNAISADTDDCILWPFSLDGKGYSQIRLQGRGQRGHRYVCETVHGPATPPRNHVAHACGVPACVNPRHLRWATRSENMRDTLIHDTHKRGERKENSKLTEADILEIRRLASAGIPQRKIAQRFGVSLAAVSLIHRRQRWAWL